MEPILAIGAIIVIGILMGVKTVPQQQAWIVESLGKFDRKLEPGLNILIPFYQKVAYRHSLKEAAIEVPEQPGITLDARRHPLCAYRRSGCRLVWCQ